MPSIYNAVIINKLVYFESSISNFNNIITKQSITISNLIITNITILDKLN